jgi:hypothetical protein
MRHLSRSAQVIAHKEQIQDPWTPIARYARQRTYRQDVWAVPSAMASAHSRTPGVLVAWPHQRSMDAFADEPIQ